MEWLFGKRMTPEQHLDVQEDKLKKIQRKLARDERKLQRTSSNLETQATNAMRAGQHDMARTYVASAVKKRNNAKAMGALRERIETNRFDVQMLLAKSEFSDVASKEARLIKIITRDVYKRSKETQGIDKDAQALQDAAGLIDDGLEAMHESVVLDDGEEDDEETLVDDLFERIQQKIELEQEAELPALPSSLKNRRQIAASTAPSTTATDRRA